MLIFNVLYFLKMFNLVNELNTAGVNKSPLFKNTYKKYEN